MVLGIFFGSISGLALFHGFAATGRTRFNCCGGWKRRFVARCCIGMVSTLNKSSFYSLQLREITIFPSSASSKLRRTRSETTRARIELTRAFARSNPRERNKWLPGARGYGPRENSRLASSYRAVIFSLAFFVNKQRRQRHVYYTARKHNRNLMTRAAGECFIQFGPVQVKNILT